MGLMKRRQWNEASQLVNHGRIHADRSPIARSAMHHAVSGTDQAVVRELAFHPIQERGEGILMSGGFCQILIGQKHSRLVLCDKMHAMPDAVEFALASKPLAARP